MNKLEANLSLLAITFFAGIQYAFLSHVPESVTGFAFIAITNLIGFLIAIAVFFRELFRIDKKQVLRSFFMAAALFGFNYFLLLGSKGMEISIISFISCSYIIFVPIVMLFFKKKASLNNIIGIVVVLFGLFMALGVSKGNIFNIHVLYLLISDVCFALYIVTIDVIADKSNPAILVMGQMFFCTLLGLACWFIEGGLAGLSLPSSIEFWVSVFFISFFIRGFYSVVQIYAQRYMSALNVSLIFSSGVIFTLLMSPLLSTLMGAAKEEITVFKIIGCVLIIIGVLVADKSVAAVVIRMLGYER